MCKLYERGYDFDLDDYFQWLIEKVKAHSPKRCNYLSLLKTLFTTDFVYIIERDKNRAGDGVGLREEYCYDAEYDYYYDDYERPCSVLEMLIALSLRCERTITGEVDNDHPERLFWLMIDNLGLGDMTDDNFDPLLTKQILKKWMTRKFKRNGEGGLFPLKKPFEDQRKVEIWFQLLSFVNENNLAK